MGHANMLLKSLGQVLDPLVADIPLPGTPFSYRATSVVPNLDVKSYALFVLCRICCTQLGCQVFRFWVQSFRYNAANRVAKGNG